MTAYLIVDITVHNPDEYRKYVQQVPAIVAKHGGTYLVRGEPHETLEGDWQPGRVVVLQFPDVISAKAFVDDPDYVPVKAIRHRAATSQMIVVGTN